MIARVRKHYRQKKEEVHPNQDESKWHKLSSFLLPKDESGGKKKSKIGDLRPPLVSSYAIANYAT